MSRDAQINARLPPLNSAESARSRSSGAFEWRSAVPRNFLIRDRSRSQTTLRVVVGAQIGLEIGTVCFAGRNIAVGKAGGNKAAAISRAGRNRAEIVVSYKTFAILREV